MIIKSHYLPKFSRHPILKNKKSNSFTCLTKHFPIIAELRICILDTHLGESVSQVNNLEKKSLLRLIVSWSLFCPLPYIHWGFPGGSDSKESACNAGDQDSIPELKRSSGEWN